MLNLKESDLEKLDASIKRIEEKGHDKLHSNRGSMSNRVSVAIYDMLEKKEDYKDKFSIISKHIYGL